MRFSDLNRSNTIYLRVGPLGAKAWLPFGAEIMLPRVVRLLGEAVDPVVVVAAPEQEVPPVPANVAIVRDEEKGRGPLQGLAVFTFTVAVMAVLALGRRPNYHSVPSNRVAPAAWLQPRSSSRVAP